MKPLYPDLAKVADLKTVIYTVICSEFEINLLQTGDFVDKAMEEKPKHPTNQYRKAITVCFYGNEDHQLCDAIRAEAKRQDRPVSSLFRQIARDYLAKSDCLN